jgi:hypothetical protein
MSVFESTALKLSWKNRVVACERTIVTIEMNIGLKLGEKEPRPKGILKYLNLNSIFGFSSVSNLAEIHHIDQDKRMQLAVIITMGGRYIEIGIKWSALGIK